MQTTVLMAALSLTLGAANAMAQTPQEQAAIVLPHAYSGYSQPEITKCQGNGPLSRECTVPAMTAGRYLIEAAAAADSTGANATQTLAIRLSGAPCVATNPAAFTGKQGLHVGCVVTLLTD
ncbi:MAG TPA: hypothetical protein VE309_06660, partial [Caulobacteraceae bacterium]|nr:hypothetical protein [Caulobacteraceae bacterium]